MATDPKINKDAAVNLQKVARLNEANRKLSAEAAEVAEVKAAQRRVEAWDRAMNRTFKGIMPSPSRHAMLGIALERYEAENAS